MTLTCEVASYKNISSRQGNIPFITKSETSHRTYGTHVMWHDDTLALYFSRESHMLARILRLNILKEHKYFDKKKKTTTTTLEHSCEIWQLVWQHCYCEVLLRLCLGLVFFLTFVRCLFVPVLSHRPWRWDDCTHVSQWQNATVSANVIKRKDIDPTLEASEMFCLVLLTFQKGG